MKDIEIARSIKLLPIKKIATKIGIKEKDLEYYGKYKAKIDFTHIKSESKGKVILVTAINPTSLGEGKTTVSIGLHDALCKLNVNSILALREPSLGPVFGIKGGAAGGGYSQVAPMVDINLHFTGDFHAITSANNLLCAMIDNHIFQGNELGIDPNKIIFNRTIDLNDRALRTITISSNATGKEPITRQDHFTITAASEIMAILALSKNQKDLKTNLSNITIGYSFKGKPIYAKDLKASDALTILLKDAINPNLVQTLEHNPVLIHCGPFANIAHGCNSVIATDLARKLGDVVVTEAGFGADLGAEKFLDIKCREMNISPSCIVLVCTIRALKLHGGESIDNITTNDLTSLKKGLSNLKKHLENLINVFNMKVVVALNQFDTDTNEEMDIVTNFTKEINIQTIITNIWKNGSEGGLDLAKAVMKIINSDSPNKLAYSYELTDSVTDKIYKIATKVYGASNVLYSEDALKDLEAIKKRKLENLPIVIAKTQYSLSDDPKLLYIDKPFNINIMNIEIHSGAKMLVAIAGKMLLMPGLSKRPAAVNMKINGNKIEGLF